MKLYFAYGANLNRDNMAWRCPDAVTVQPFYLLDWRLAFSGVATIQPRPGDRVPGALWAISDADEQALDIFEGWPSLYRKETVRQDSIDFMVYVMNSDPPAEPSGGYVATIAQGYQDWGLDLGCLDRAIQTTITEQWRDQDPVYQDLERHSQWLRETVW